MLNYMKKFALEILPSVAATVIGAYIVNHYISRPATNAPVAAAVAPAGAKKHAKPTDVVNIPEPGVTAKGISERAMMEKSAAERPAEVKPTGPKAAEAKAQLGTGKSYFRKAGVEHDVLNETASEIVFLEIELKP